VLTIRSMAITLEKRADKKLGGSRLSSRREFICNRPRRNADIYEWLIKIVYPTFYPAPDGLFGETYTNEGGTIVIIMIVELETVWMLMLLIPLASITGI